MSVIITGATGCVGKKILNHLVNQQIPVIALGRNKHRMSEVFHQINPDIKCFSLDDVHNISFSQDDILLHCAFSRSQEGKDLIESINFSQAVFKIAAEKNISAIVNVSSQSVYGKYRPHPSQEQDEIDPADKYAVAKYTTEILLDLIARQHGIPYTNIRLASLVGEGMDERLITKLILKVMDGETLVLEGGQQTYSFMDVDDAVDGLLALLQSNPAQWQTIYNLGQSQCYTLSELAGYIVDRVKTRLNKHIAVEVVPKEVNASMTLDVSRFRKDFSWEAKTDIMKIIDKIIDSKGQYIHAA